MLACQIIAALGVVPEALQGTVGVFVREEEETQ
jgi:hypothetical protein